MFAACASVRRSSRDLWQATFPVNFVMVACLRSE